MGGTGDTEFTGKDLNKFIPDIWKAEPKTKKCIQGLIHSHHTMGAFHSGTDTKQMREAMGDVKYIRGMDNFYPSLVVSSSSNKELAFAVAWRDQYNILHLAEKIPVLLEGNKVIVNEEWKKEAETIQAKATKEKKTKKYKTGFITGYTDGYGQLPLPVNNTTYSGDIYNKSLLNLSANDITFITSSAFAVRRYVKACLGRGGCSTQEELNVFETLLDTAHESDHIEMDELNGLWAEATNYVDMMNPLDEDETEDFNQSFQYSKGSS